MPEEETPQADIKTPSVDVLVRGVQACIENGERLVDETFDLEFRQPPSSRFYLAMIAQEEFAKAFILYLIKEHTIPFDPYILRAMRDHVCKQLVGIIMDYVIMHWDDIEELEAMVSNEPYDAFPADVASAMNLLRHEKIRRWESRNWFWAEDPIEDPSTLKIFKGKKDQRKQDAIYVRIGSDGSVCSTPQIIGEKETQDEVDRAKRYNSFVSSLLDGDRQNYRYNKAIAALKFLFSTTNVCAVSVNDGKERSSDIDE